MELTYEQQCRLYKLRREWFSIDNELEKNDLPLITYGLCKTKRFAPSLVTTTWRGRKAAKKLPATVKLDYFLSEGTTNFRKIRKYLNKLKPEEFPKYLTASYELEVIPLLINMTYERIKDKC